MTLKQLTDRLAVLEAESKELGNTGMVVLIGDTPPTAEQQAKIEAGAVVLQVEFVKPPHREGTGQ